MMTGSPSPDAAQWVAALNHPLRRSILRILGEQELASATEIAKHTGVRLGNVAYHIKVLNELEILGLVRRRQVRGAFEKFYRAAEIEGKVDWVGVVLERTRKSDPSL
jgi:DNA-binding transcriptional ArsR family regulator